MDLKNALAVCLISLFSAALVLLIARALDMQAASRLEPQLAKIVEELEALRKQGGIASAPGAAAEGESVDNALVVYYFHGNTRCPTCRAIESQSYETVQADFASQLESGEVVWNVLNYEAPAGADLAKQFDIQVPVVVLARLKGGQVADWKRLDQVWGLVDDKPAFTQYVRDEITQMLKTADEQPLAASDGDPPEIPIPNVDLSDVPVPTVSGDIPVPQ